MWDRIAQSQEFNSEILMWWEAGDLWSLSPSGLSRPQDPETQGPQAEKSFSQGSIL